LISQTLSLASLTFYNTFNTFNTLNSNSCHTSKVMIEHSSCLMCVACHPTIPSLVACGSFNGEVLVFDLTLANTSSSLGASSSASSASSSSSLRAVVMGEGDGGNDDDVNGDDGNGGGPLIHASSIDDYFHREPVR
jgi:hypothetical protein